MNARSTAASDDLIEAQAAARAHGFTRDSWIFLSLAASITVIRTYSRWSMVRFKRFQADDFLVWLALVGENPVLGWGGGETLRSAKFADECIYVS